jgi:hypothetical protein
MNPQEIKAMLLVAASQLAAAAVGAAQSVQGLVNGVMATTPVNPDTAGQDPGLRAKELILSNKTTDFYVWLLAAYNDQTVFVNPPAPVGTNMGAPGGGPNLAGMTAAGVASLLTALGKASVVSANPAIATALGTAMTALQAIEASGTAAAPTVAAAPVVAPSPLASSIAGS